MGFIKKLTTGGTPPRTHRKHQKAIGSDAKTCPVNTHPPGYPLVLNPKRTVFPRFWM